MSFIRKATVDDVDTVFHIRNHLVVRQASWNTEPLVYDKHVAWFSKNFGFYWMIYDDKGFVRIKDGEVSIAVDPRFHNMDIGSEALRSICACEDVCASIRFDNPGSIRCFIKAGFITVGLIMKNKLIFKGSERE